MSGTGFGLIDGAAALCLGFLVIGMIVALVRLVRGPSLPDRVVGLDMLVVLMVAFAATFAIAVDEAAFVDMAIALALVGFLGTVAFARYAERRAAFDRSRGKAKEGSS